MRVKAPSSVSARLPLSTAIAPNTYSSAWVVVMLPLFQVVLVPVPWLLWSRAPDVRMPETSTATSVKYELGPFAVILMVVLPLLAFMAYAIPPTSELPV